MMSAASLIGFASREAVLLDGKRAFALAVELVSNEVNGSSPTA
jgi:hypothetical protein